MIQGMETGVKKTAIGNSETRAGYGKKKCESQVCPGL